MVKSIIQNFNANNAQYSALKTVPNNQNHNLFISDVYKDFYFKNPTALNPKGQLVDSHTSKNIFKEYTNAAKNFYKALKGQGGDYEIGKLNDSAVGLSSLGIAALLSSKASSPMMKAMEFVGFGTWFLAMSVWPKVFIGKPVKALTGVDINQEYIDSQGRTKRFFQDPQYLPWDLMSNEQINKAGKKLRIPENIENRREVIQDKMKQIATQTNTLWMLTAGFSTPILSSLMADQLRQPVKKLINVVNTGLAKIKLDSATNSTGIISNVISKFSDLSAKTDKKTLEKLLNQGNAQDLNKFFNGLADKLNSREVKTAVTEKINNITANNMKNEEILGLYNNLKSLIKNERALFGYHKAALVDGIGNSWMDSSKNLLKTLKMPSATLRKLAECNVEKRAEIIANHLAGLKPEELTRIAQEVNKIAKMPVNKARGFQAIVDTFIRKPFKHALEAIAGKDETKNIVKQVKNKFEDRLCDIDSSFRGIAKVLENAKGKNAKELAALLGGIKASDAWTELGEILKNNGEEALKNRLKESISNKKTVNKIVDIIKNQDSSKIKALGKLLGQAPQDLLADAARDVVTYKGWLKKVGLIGGGILLGLTLLTIFKMGKTNSYNRDVYKSKEAAGNESSK